MPLFKVITAIIRIRCEPLRKIQIHKIIQTNQQWLTIKLNLYVITGKYLNHNHLN